MPDVNLTIIEAQTIAVGVSTGAAVKITVAGGPQGPPGDPGAPGPQGDPGAPGYVIFTGTLVGEETLLDAVDWFQGKWDIIVRSVTGFYMSTVSGVSDGSAEPFWVETDIVVGGITPTVRLDISAGQMRVLVAGSDGWAYEIKRHVFAP